METLTELQTEALLEILNIAVGKAAATLAEIGREEVLLSVPTLMVTSRSDAARILDVPLSPRICGISQHFQGAFTTDAILLFPEDQSLEIVRMMVGDRIPLSELTEMEQEAMTEIGNIILNSCVGTVADIFQDELTGSLPAYRLGTTEEILHGADPSAAEIVLLLHIEFTLEKKKVRGTVCFLLGVSAFEDLRRHLDVFLGKQLG